MKKKDLLLFFKNDSSISGIFLIISAAIAMIASNIEITRNLYQSFLEIPVELHIGMLEFKGNILSWIDDALMAIFFLLISLEIKCELIEGSLSSYKKALFPIIASIGGMVVPALIYLIFNFQNPIARYGWAIPVTTDIAFALGVLALLGNRIPMSLKTFLMTLAMIDDFGAMLIVAVFYTNNLSIFPIGIATIAIIILLIFNLSKILNISTYLLTGIVLWVAILKSGVHATLAGVIVGFFIPGCKEKGKKSPIKILKKILKPWVSFLILPLFAFANAGLFLGNLPFLDKIIFTFPIGIIAGLFIGKPIGISLFCWLSLKLKIADLPNGVTYKQIVSVGVLCGIGFTMSIFISTLAFKEYSSEFIVLAKFGVLVGSILAAFFGYILLKIRFLSIERKKSCFLILK